MAPPVPRAAGADDRIPALQIDAPRHAVLPAHGKALSVPMTAIDPSLVRLQLERAPLGMRLTPSGSRGWNLHWQPAERTFATTVVLSAVLRARPGQRQRIEIRLVPETAPPIVSPSSELDATLSLAAVPPQRLRVGKPWALWLRPRDATATAGRETIGTAAAREPELVLDSAPRALTIQPFDGGWYRLAWLPQSTGEVEFEAVAQYPDGRPGEAWQRIRLTVVDRNAPLEPRAEPEPDIAAARPDEALLPPALDLLQAPGFEPLANPIVSAGRAVVFKVVPTLPDGQQAIVQIDRLPRGARFDEAHDGSRTFHWATGERDQGEHRFRLTATNAEDASLRDTAEITVIVGDPTRSRTAPAQ